METRQTTPEHATYKMINTKCLRQERHHDNQSFASVLSTPHAPAPTSPENSCGSRAAWTEVKWESKCAGINCSNGRNTENYGFYRAGHLSEADLGYLCLSSGSKQETLIWEVNGEGM